MSSSHTGDGQHITSLADISPEKKISVLKKAIVSLTKQKQDIESQRSALEAKVMSLVNELGIQEDTITEYKAKNKELQRQLDAVTSRFSLTGSASAVALKAGSLLSVLSSTKEGPTAAGTSPVSGDYSMTKEDQQKIFEENEALHIQLFEIKQMCDKKVKAAVAERSEMALRLHSLEGLLASFQASDVEQSHHAQETARLLAMEKSFTAMCEVLLFEDNYLRRELATVHEQVGEDRESNLFIAKTGLTVILGELCDGLEEILNAVSAALPHLPVGLLERNPHSPIISPAESKREAQANKERERHAAFSASHKQFVQRIKVEILKVKNCLLASMDLGDGEDTHLLIPAIKALLSELQMWLCVVYNNCGILMKPMENLFKKRQQEAMDMNQQSVCMVSSLDLHIQLRNLISSFCGQLKAFEKCLDIKSDNSTFVFGSDALRVLFSILGYRSTTSNSHHGLEFERYLFSLNITLKEPEEGSSKMIDKITVNDLPKHFTVPLLHLTVVLQKFNTRIRSIVRSTVHYISNDSCTTDMANAPGDTSSDQYSADFNAHHFNDLYHRSVMELANAHDQIERLVKKVSKVEGANKKMKKEYISVVDVYESQIRLLSDRLAELSGS
eukprot:Tbor_TRINITY_DN5846_c0_g9::TRINITY_DN5846_c0_g9_i1::g.7196::m.7196